MKRTTTTAIACAAALIYTSSPLLGQTGDGYVGVFGDAAGTIRCIDAPPWVPFTLYVVAKTCGRTVNGISGAEFRIEFSNPSGYVLNYAAPGNALLLGDPLSSTGVNITSYSCQTPDSGAVSLGTIWGYNFGSGGQCEIIVKRRNPPRNPTYQCALLVHCDDPAFTQSCNTAPADTSCLTQKAGGSGRLLSDDEFATFLDGYQPAQEYRGYEGFRISDPFADFRGAEALIDAREIVLVNEVRVWVGIDNGSASFPKWIQVGYARRSGFGLTGYYEYWTANDVYSGPRYVGVPSGQSTYRAKKSGLLTEIYTAGAARPAPAWSEFVGRGAFDEAFFGAEEWDTEDCMPGCLSTPPGDECHFVGSTLYNVSEQPGLVNFSSS